MKLLVIEDEMSLQEIMSSTLRKEGYIVETASTSASTPEKSRSMSPNPAKSLRPTSR